VTRVGDETVGEMWSLFDGQDILDEVDPAFSENIRRHVDRVVRLDPFHAAGPIIGGTGKIAEKFSPVLRCGRGAAGEWRPPSEDDT
jgi:hypothetical protein